MFDTISASSMAVGGIAGVLIGVGYFGGLWWTVSRMPHARHPLQLYFGSLLIRLVIVLAACWGVLAYFGWLPLVAALAGLSLSKLLLVRSVMHTMPADAARQEAL